MKRTSFIFHASQEPVFDVSPQVNCKNTFLIWWREEVSRNLHNRLHFKGDFILESARRDTAVKGSMEAFSINKRKFINIFFK